MLPLSIIFAQVTLNVNLIQLTMAFISGVIAITMAIWRIDKSRKKDIDEKFAKKVDKTIFEAFKEDNKEEHIRYEQGLKELDKSQKEFQKDMGVKIDKIYEYIIDLTKKG